MVDKPFLLFGKPHDEAHRDEPLSKRELCTLKTLRGEIVRRIKFNEKKEAKLRDLEKKIAGRERAVLSAESRIPKLQSEGNNLRSNISILEKAFREKQAVLDQRKQAIAQLSRELASLLEKRSEVRRVEAGLAEVLAKEKQLRDDISKKEKRVAEGAQIISKQEDDIDKHMNILKNLRDQLEQAVPLKKQLDSELEIRQQALLKAKRDLAGLESAVKDLLQTREQLNQKSALLSIRERKIVEAESRIGEMKKDVERLTGEADTVQKSKQELYALIEDKKHLLDDLKKNIAQNSQLSSEAHERELNARKAEHELLVAQREHDRKLKSFEAKEQEMIRKEATLLDHEKAVKEATRILAKDKDDFANEVNARKAEMLLVQQEWEKKIKVLQDEKVDLKQEKADVRKLVESDVLGLKEKEDELVESIEVLERDKDKLKEEEKSLLKRVSELERAKAEFELEFRHLSGKEKRITDGERIIQKGMKYIQDEKKRIEQEKDIIYRARDLKKVLPELERRYGELRRGIGKAEARLIGGRAQPTIIESLKKREKELSMKEEGVHYEFKKLLEHENEVEALEQRKERAFSEYLREEVERVQVGKPGRELAHPEIHAMIDDAREKVMQGSIDEAVRMVAEVEVLVDKIQDPAQKRLFYYDLRDLKTSIKLASLT
ncbi:Chromosome partition protein Smc [uncultured archaeon]|nr:Chromosome partition protein Smc [uncultured archaeon]